MSELKINYEQVVSGRDRTLQDFDFLAQTLDQMIDGQDCNRVLLCELVKSYANSRQWGLDAPIGQLQQASPNQTIGG